MIQCGEIKVRGFHIDIFSHVNNARYLEFMEEARWVIIDKYIGIKRMQAKGIIFVVVNININYRNHQTRITPNLYLANFLKNFILCLFDHNSLQEIPRIY